VFDLLFPGFLLVRLSEADPGIAEAAGAHIKPLEAQTKLLEIKSMFPHDEED